MIKVPKRRSKARCSVKGCKKLAHSRGMCRAHYDHKRRARAKYKYAGGITL